jgi:hypothetical protein
VMTTYTTCKSLTTAALVALLLAPAPGWAQEENPITDAPREQKAKPEPPPPPEAPPPPPPMLVLGLGAGVYVPTSKLGPNFLVGIDAAYQLPWMDGRFGVGLGLAYSQPTISGEIADDRVPQGVATYDATMQELVLNLQFTFRLFHWGSRWSPHAGIGPVLYFLSHNVDSLGQSQSETSTQAGFWATVGADFRIWRGALVGEVRFPFATVGQRTTGDSNVGAISVVLGYRFRI